MSNVNATGNNSHLSILLAFPVLTLASAGRWRFGGRNKVEPAREPDPAPSPEIAPIDRLGPYGRSLREAAARGEREALLRRLDRELPEWPASSTLIEAVRDIFALEAALDAARATGALEVITNRLADDIRETSELLWRRAEKLVAAGSTGIETPRLREDLQREDEQLDQVRVSIRESRAALAELAMTGEDRSDALGKAERRFRVLAATARDLQEFDRDSRP